MSNYGLRKENMEKVQLPFKLKSILAENSTVTIARLMIN